VDPYLLDLRRSIKDPLIDNNIIKANIFVAKFFPKTKIVDLSDMETIREQNVFNISPTILTEEISKLIRSLLNRKVLGLNSILNKVLKVAALVIAKNLAEVASYCFASGIILESLKESITVVLCKEGKKDYSLPGSYRLIALENMLVKVLKKYIANIISKAAEEYGLLL